MKAIALQPRRPAAAGSVGHFRKRRRAKWCSSSSRRPARICIFVGKPPTTLPSDWDGFLRRRPHPPAVSRSTFGAGRYRRASLARSLLRCSCRRPNDLLLVEPGPCSRLRDDSGRRATSRHRSCRAAVSGTTESSTTASARRSRDRARTIARSISGFTCSGCRRLPPDRRSCRGRRILRPSRRSRFSDSISSDGAPTRQDRLPISMMRNRRRECSAIDPAGEIRAVVSRHRSHVRVSRGSPTGTAGVGPDGCGRHSAEPRSTGRVRRQAACISTGSSPSTRLAGARLRRRWFDRYDSRSVYRRLCQSVRPHPCPQTSSGRWA